MSVQRQFQRRAEAVPRLGVGLSVDVYSPDLWDLMSRFEGQPSRPAYLEIFRAETTALQAVKRSFARMPLAYHGEGLWITQPEFSTSSFLERDLNDVAAQLHLLASPWINHECATKQMAGYSFGTYLPPLYTPESARLVADNIALVQERLDKSLEPGEGMGPLFLLEMPPLTYFMAGTIGVPEYFRLVCERTACGLVLDIGHLWTVYRYSAARRHSSLEQFVDEFLDTFPMERIIEIHLAGLAVHETTQASLEDLHPEWIDAHAAPIPAVSWTLLEQVFAHPRLCNLRGVALEVDTKPVDVIVEEFVRARALVGATVEQLLNNATPVPDPTPQLPPYSPHDGRVTRLDLEAEYVSYAKIASGQQPPVGTLWSATADDPTGLERYVHRYLPHEILHWGGELSDMFPETYGHLTQQGLSLEEFVPWWFLKARPAEGPYDFFQLKIDRFLEFVSERAPAFLEMARREAATLRAAYEDANTAGRAILETCR